MTPEYLKELLPSLLNADFAGATNVRLLSLARTYAALCDLATFDFPSGEYGTRKIWLRERCRRESDAALRCRMVHAMYTLVCGTVSGDVSKRKGGCFAMADELVRDCLGGNEKRSSLRPDESELLIRTGVCHCLIDLLYPGPDAGDEYLLLLKRQISGWIAEMNRDGSWSGVSPDVALERIGVMNRYSYAFLDKTNDSAVKRSFEYFRNSLPVPEDAGNFDENYLYTLARLYDTAVLGNAYDPDRRLARPDSVLLRRRSILLRLLCGSLCRRTNRHLAICCYRAIYCIMTVLNLYLVYTLCIFYIFYLLSRKINNWYGNASLLHNHYSFLHGSSVGRLDTSPSGEDRSAEKHRR